MSTVLFDAPGPRARLRHSMFTLLALIVIAALVYLTYARFAEAGQWDAAIWEPFLRPDTWTQYIIPGLLGTLRAAGLAAVAELAPKFDPDAP